MKSHRSISLPIFVAAALLVLAGSAQPQMLINIEFGGGAGVKAGMAATGLGTNDAWNLYRHYEPKFTPGMILVANGKLAKLKFADGSESAASVAVNNAPGVWGNSSGDPMYDSYMFAQNGSNIVVTVSGLPSGRYHFYLYGHADADVSGEQTSVFTLKAGTNNLGPLTQVGGSSWKAGNPWQERAQFVVFRDVAVGGEAVVIEVAPGPNGVAVLNGLQILSRGTSPPRAMAAVAPEGAAVSTNLLFREIHYEGKVSDNEARFGVTLSAESMTTNEISAPLFEGNVALVSPELPAGLRIVSHGRQTRLFCSRAGVHPIKLELIARITRAEPWNQISFSGPAAAIASVSALAAAGVEMQMMSGTQVSPGAGKAAGAPGVQGFLGADRTVALRWQSRGTEVARKSLVTVDTAASAQVTPTVIKFTTALHYEILQAPIPRLRIELPATHALTKIQGEQIRDWQIVGADVRRRSPPESTADDRLLTPAPTERQVLVVEFIKPVEKTCALTLFSEQMVGTTPLAATLLIPQPLEVERESGSFTVSADDTMVEIESTVGLRQVNAAAGALAAYRFNGRPVSLAAKLRRIEPVLKLADRATARLEDTRLLVSHALSLTVEKAGIYALDLTPQAGFVVTEVKGEGIDDWKASEGKVKVSFTSRVLGARKIQVQLERADKEFPEQISIEPLGVAGATNVTTQLGAASSPGIRLKTAELSGLREMPVSSLPERADELLAFASDQAGWRLTLAAEKLAPRVVAEVFDLVTIGDGLVGGSATIRYGIINQGVQEFRVAVPPHWKNLEFTGSNIRRKEPQTNIWTITLQDKAWGGYTLVVTYDYQFDPKGATLDLAGAHTLGVERETGSLGVMTAASLKLTPAAPAEPLRRVDEAELSESDRALCTRPLLLAYKYTGGKYRHSVEVKRFEEVSVLDAVADRTELTTVLTEEGQLLTQSSFMVKNNEKQFQKFKLPKNSEFWSSYVNGQPAKPERDGDWYLVPLPRDANRDQAFAVDIVYKQTVDLKTWLFPRRIELAAPLTDIPNTYAEWQLFAPGSQRLTGFSGNMTVASGTTYGLHEAWQAFLGFYGDLFDNHLGAIFFCFLTGLVIVLVVVALRRGGRGVVEVLVVFSILAILAAMLLPALSKAKSRAQRINVVNNLKQIGLAARTWGMDNKDQFPPNFEAMMNELSTDKVTYDPRTGQRLIYVGAGKSDAYPEGIIAYSASDVNGRAVVFADGSVQVLNQEKFEQALQRDAAVPRAVMSANASGVATATFSASTVAANPPPAPSAAPVPAPTVAPRDFFTTPTAGVAAPQPASAPAQAKAMATGVRPIRIEIPHAGQAFNFTKVLNVGREPLNVSVSVARWKVYRTVQMICQVSAFCFGLVLLWALALSSRRQSFWMTVAVALVIWAVASLLLMWRWLHVGLIIVAPCLVFGLITWIAWKWWRHHKAARAAVTPPQPPAIPTAGSLAGLLLLLALLAPTSMMATDPNPAPSSDAFSIVSASYTGTVGDRVAQFEATLQLWTVATNQTIPLFGEGVAIESFAAQGDARLVPDGDSIGVLVPGRGEVSLKLKLVAKLTGDVSRRQLAFAIPSALSSRVSLVIDEPDADVEFPTAVAFERSSANLQTRVQAVIGSAERLELNWTPRVKRAAEIAATVFVQNAALITLGGGVLNTRASLEYQVSQGELKQLRVAIPAGQRVLRVEGESLRLWEIKEDLLLVELLKGVSPAYKLTVETEKLLDKLPATVRLEIPHGLEVKRETGLVALRGSEELALTVEEARDLQRVDAEEFYRAAPDKKDGIHSAFRFLKSDFGLNVRAEAVRPQVEAEVRNHVLVGTESVRVAAQIEYTIKRAGVFALRLGLPEGYRLESITGANVSQWIEYINGTRLVEITLKERTIGSYSLTARLSQSYKEPPKSLPIVGLHPLGAEKLSGFVIISTEHGLAAKTESLDGLTEIPSGTAGTPPAFEDAAAAQTGALAYKFITATPGPEPSWKLSVATETVEPWVRAELLNTVTLTETLVSGRTQIRYDIANAPIKEFRLRVPAAFKNVEISGAQIRRRDQTNEEWRVELQSKVRGQYLLTVAWEMPKSANTNLIELSGVQTLGVERETGFLSLSARPPLQVAEKSATELLNKIDVRELPEWAGRADAATVLAYRYLRPGYKLAVEARRYEEAEVLQALIDSLRLTTVIADDGQVMTEMALNIRNNGRQHLEIELPAGATVWSAFAGGEPIRPSLREGKLLLPLMREVASDAPVAIELTFVGADPFPKHHGPVSLLSPRFDVPVKNARWDLYLPPDYDYSKFGGSMNRISDAAAPMVQVFSLSEYNEQQRSQEAQNRTEVSSGLKAAREKLSGGNLREAIGSYKRAKGLGQWSQAAGGDKDLKEVESDLRKAQTSNLLSAQNSYAYENGGRLADQSALQLQQPGANAPAQQQIAFGGRAGLSVLNNEAEVAGQQWDKLEKAQQVAVAKVAPLRVNLPTRGVHYTFSQVLQTELRKPLTVKLMADNTKTPNWLGRIFYGIVGFGFLWMLMAVINSQRGAKSV